MTISIKIPKLINNHTINNSVAIDWGDGNILNLTTDLPSHDYDYNGEYTITILGSFNHFGSNEIMSDYNTGLVSFLYNNQVPSLTIFENAFANVYTDSLNPSFHCIAISRAIF